MKIYIVMSEEIDTSVLGKPLISEVFGIFSTEAEALEHKARGSIYSGELDSTDVNEVQWWIS